jgi:hypothetical protein
MTTGPGSCSFSGDEFEGTKWPGLDAALEQLFSYGDPVTGKYILVRYIFWLAVTVVMKARIGNREPLWALLSPTRVGYITHSDRETPGQRVL